MGPKLFRTLLKMFLFLLFLELFLRIGAGISIMLQARENQKHLKNSKAVRVLCLGDSLTYHGGINSYPSQLQKLLNQGVQGRSFEVINMGQSSSTTDDALMSLKIKLERYKPNIVVMMEGINDTQETVAVEGDGMGSVEVFFTHIRLVRMARMLWRDLKAAWDDDFYKILTGKSYAKAEEDEATPAEDYFERAGLAACVMPQETILLEKMRNFPQDYGIVMDLINFYEFRDAYPLAEKYCRMALPGAPASVKLILLNHLAGALKDQGRYAEAQDIYFFLLKLAEKNKDLSEVSNVINSLIDLFMQWGDFKNAGFLIARQVALNPANVPYMSMVHYYSMAGKDAELQDILGGLLAAMVSDKDLGGYFDVLLQLGYLEARNKEYSKAKDIFRQEISVCMKVTSGRDMGCSDRAMQGLDFIDSLSKSAVNAENQGFYYYPATIHNYKKIINTVISGGAIFLAVQYPMLSVEPLEKFLGSRQGLVFVDNNVSFQEAVKSEGYDMYFEDNFAKYFGHCTVNGYHLLAEDVYGAILKAIK